MAAVDLTFDQAISESNLHYAACRLRNTAWPRRSASAMFSAGIAPENRL
jgi:hypothetical protein